jgi:hypothetical protein
MKIENLDKAFRKLHEEAMKLIVDNSNVETIPVGNLMDIAAMARRFADQVDANDYGEVTQRVDEVMTLTTHGMVQGPQ